MRVSILTTVVFILFYFLAGAKTTRSTTSGPWNNSGTWDNGIPVAGDEVYIENGDAVTLNVTTSISNLYIEGNSTSLTINSGKVLFISNYIFMIPTGNSQSNSLVINGILYSSKGMTPRTVSGFTNYTANISGSGLMQLVQDLYNFSLSDGSMTVNLGCAVECRDIYNYSTGGSSSMTLNLTDSINVKRNIILQAKIVAASGLNINMNSASARIRMAGIFDIRNNGGQITQGTAESIFYFSNLANHSTNSNLSFRNIVVDANSLTGNVNLSNLTNSLIIPSGVTLNTNGNNLSLAGNLVNNGTLTMGSSDQLTFNGTSAQAFGGSGTNNIGELVVNNNAGLTISTTSDVEVNTQVTLTDGSIATGGKLKLMNSGSGMANLGEIASGHTVTGDITCQFTTGALTNVGYRQLCMPVSGVQMADIQYHATNQPNGIETWGFTGANSRPSNAASSSYTFSPSAANAAGNMDNGWVKFTGSTQSIGYVSGTTHYVGPVSIGGKGTYTFDVTGAPNTGPITINTGFAFDASKTGTLPAINLHYNWALIGNPFPSTISWASVSSASSNVEGSAYIFQQDGSGWTAATNIPPFQAFMVRADGASPSVVFNESAKVTTKAAFLKSIDEKDFIELFIRSANAPTYYSYAKLAFNPNYSNNYNSDEDAYRVKNPAPWSNVAFIANDGTPLQINKVSSDLGRKVFPINTTTYQSGQHTLTFENLENVEGCFILKDLLENKEIPLSASNNSYSFYLSDTLVADRFELSVYDFAQNVSVNNSNCFGENSGSAEIDLLNTGSDYFLNLIDNNGLIISTEFNASGNHTMNGLAPGKYILEVSSNGIACPTVNEYFTIMEPGQMKTDFDFGTDSLLFFVNEEIEFNNLSTGDIMSYEWNFGDNITSSLMNPKHSYFTEGIYSVELTASNGNSDCDVNSKKVIQVMNGRVSVESSDTENTSVKQIENSLRLNSESIISEYEILDLSGKALDSKNAIQNNSYEIDITGFDSGVYILVVKLDGGSSFTHKFYKK